MDVSFTHCVLPGIPSLISKMCEDCVKEEFPDRGSMCVDSGSYMVNYAQCADCKIRGEVKVINRVCIEEENGDEVITYQHVCKSCEHVIGDHEYIFRVEDDYQVYEMSCLLCGNGEDERSILPVDPQKQLAFF
ncbi:protein Churchill-like [Haliotis rubra]|uniref:protein Churchill-like n=1 Tax=Haliotis rubra TaxID=36100 RepID=UPI001EE52569|nr:protein Churchill-like [Haliotis rubra]